MKSLLSVIIPTFNRARLLSQAVRSVLQQSYQNIEILVVDDGSTDNTEEVVATEFGPQVRYLFQNNQGLNAARNTALREARGDYIALLDDDDLWLPWKTDVQLALLEQHPRSAYIFSDFYIFSEYSDPVPNGLYTWFKDSMDGPFPSCRLLDNRISPDTASPHPKSIRLFNCNLYAPLLVNPYVLPSTAIFRRSALPFPDPFPADNTHCGDWTFFALLSRNNPCLFLDVETALNRSHEDPIRLTRRSPIEKLKDRIDMIERVWESDAAFARANGKLVRSIKSRQIVHLCLNLLYEGKRNEAKSLLRRYANAHAPTHKLSFLIMSLFANFPGGDRLIHQLRNAKHHLRG
jgi:glycosyltransferase involved in cell wall biosynthesis